MNMPMERMLGRLNLCVQGWYVDHVHMRSIIGSRIACSMGVHERCDSLHQGKP